MTDAFAHIDTRIVHGGEIRPRIQGAAVLPLFQSSVFEAESGPEGPRIRYPRLSNTPNHEALQAKIAGLEGAEAAVLASSGMSAIVASLVDSMGKGGHVLVQEGVYGGTWSFLLQDLPEFGGCVDFIDAGRPETWEARLRPETRAIYTESMTNPLLRIADHRAVVAFARRHGLTSIIDATFTPPTLWQPILAGYDLSVHSASKYLNGHSDLVCGVVSGSRERIRSLRFRLLRLGAHLDMHACWMLHRGIRTLALRVERQCETALALARHLQKDSRILRVHFPGLEDSPERARAAELFRGCGGIFSFELAEPERAARLVEALELPVSGPSLGGIESLVTRPVTTSHVGVPREDREKAGIHDGLVRFSCGIEAASDLIADLDRALEIAFK